MSYKSIIIFTLAILFIACNNKYSVEITETYSDGSKQKELYYKISGKNRELIKEIKYYENSQKKYIGHFKDDAKDGKWTFWYEDGKIWSEGYFTKGLRTGESKVYHENGEIFFLGKYQEGKKHSKWIFYDDKGSLENEVIYDKGIIISQSVKD